MPIHNLNHVNMFLQVIASGSISSLRGSCASRTPRSARRSATWKSTCA
ncbi:hypothetical protein ACPA9J_11870 [Pseudomonas aeruginosa]